MTNEDFTREPADDLHHATVIAASALHAVCWACPDDTPKPAFGLFQAVEAIAQSLDRAAEAFDTARLRSFRAMHGKEP